MQRAPPLHLTVQSEIDDDTEPPGLIPVPNLHAGAARSQIGGRGCTGMLAPVGFPALAGSPRSALPAGHQVGPLKGISLILPSYDDPIFERNT